MPVPLQQNVRAPAVSPPLRISFANWQSLRIPKQQRRLRSTTLRFTRGGQSSLFPKRLRKLKQQKHLRLPQQSRSLVRRKHFEGRQLVLRRTPESIQVRRKRRLVPTWLAGAILIFFTVLFFFVYSPLDLDIETHSYSTRSGFIPMIVLSSSVRRLCGYWFSLVQYCTCQ